VVPAATARLLARSLRQLQLGAMALAAIESTLGLALAFQLDIPPGATISVLAASVYLALVIALPLRARLAHRASAAIGGELA
jgi:zinc transport system permease protein